MANGYRELMRRKLLEELYDKMTPDEKRLFVNYSIQGKDHEEIMDALKGISKQVEESRQSWISDFGANIAGNAAFDGFVYLLSKIIKRFG